MRVRCRLIWILALLMLQSMLSAQASPYQEAMESKRIALAYDPTNDQIRCELAYYQMLAGLPEQALENYRMVLARDNAYPDARAGELWALNTLFRYKESIALAKKYITQRSGILPRFHLANALLTIKHYHSASDQFKIVLEDNPDPVIAGLAMENLVWSYLGTGDIAHAQYVNKQISGRTGRSPDPALAAALGSLFYSAELLYGIKDSNAWFWSVAGGARCHAFSMKLTFDQFRLEGQRLRDSYSLDVSQQFIPADIAFNAQYLTGTESRIYPGASASLSVSPKLHIGPVEAIARAAGSASIYKRHNAYQYDLGLILQSDPGSIGYQAAKVFQDNEAVGSDATRWVHSLDVSLNLWKEWKTGVHFGTGNLAWYKNAQGSITDDFEPVDNFAGISLGIPVLKSTRAVLYYQYGSNDDTTSHLAYARLYAWF